MKKWLTLLLASSVLVGCQDTTEEQPTDETEQTEEETNEESNSTETGVEEASDEATAEIGVYAEDDEVANEEVSFEEGDILMDVMEENFDVEETDGFVDAIEGYEEEQDEGLFWLFDVNGEMAPVGANEYELADQDVVEWTLEDTE